MRIAAGVILLGSALAWADGEACKKERPLTKAELAFYERAKGSAKALPPAPKGWELHPEEIAIPAKLCADGDPWLKKGEARFTVSTETEYRDPTDRTAKMEVAIKLGMATADEEKKTAALAKKLETLVKSPKPDAAALAAAQSELEKLGQVRTARANQALHEAGLDAQARIRIGFNPTSESATGCSYQKTISATKVDGVALAFTGSCDLTASPQDAEGGTLLLFGAWKVTGEGNDFSATAAYDPKKPHTVLQALSVQVFGDGTRAAELLKAIDVKALGALVGK